MKKRTIAISGPPGSGSTSTAKILAEKLNLNYFSPGRLYKDIATGKFETQFYANIFKELCAKRNLEIPSFNEKDDSNGAVNLWQTEFGKSPKLHEAIDELQIILSEKGGIVIDGKLSLHMLRKADTKIWMFADLEERAKRTVKRDGIDPEKSVEIVKKRESFERTEWNKIYGFDYLDQESQAHIKIDTTQKTSEQVADEILNFLDK